MIRKIANIIRLYEKNASLKYFDDLVRIDAILAKQLENFKKLFPDRQLTDELIEQTCNQHQKELKYMKVSVQKENNLFVVYSQFDYNGVTIMYVLNKPRYTYGDMQYFSYFDKHKNTNGYYRNKSKQIVMRYENEKTLNFLMHEYSHYLDYSQFNYEELNNPEICRNLKRLYEKCLSYNTYDSCIVGFIIYTLFITTEQTAHSLTCDNIITLAKHICYLPTCKQDKDTVSCMRECLTILNVKDIDDNTSDEKVFDTFVGIAKKRYAKFAKLSTANLATIYQKLTDSKKGKYMLSNNNVCNFMSAYIEFAKPLSIDFERFIDFTSTDDLRAFASILKSNVKYFDKNKTSLLALISKFDLVKQIGQLFVETVADNSDQYCKALELFAKLATTGIYNLCVNNDLNYNDHYTLILSKLKTTNKKYDLRFIKCQIDYNNDAYNNHSITATITNNMPAQISSLYNTLLYLADDKTKAYWNQLPECPIMLKEIKVDFQIYIQLLTQKSIDKICETEKRMFDQKNVDNNALLQIFINEGDSNVRRYFKEYDYTDEYCESESFLISLIPYMSLSYFQELCDFNDYKDLLRILHLYCQYYYHSSYPPKLELYKIAEKFKLTQQHPEILNAIIKSEKVDVIFNMIRIISQRMRQKNKNSTFDFD